MSQLKHRQVASSSLPIPGPQWIGWCPTHTGERKSSLFRGLTKRQYLPNSQPRQKQSSAAIQTAHSCQADTNKTFQCSPLRHSVRHQGMELPTLQISTVECRHWCLGETSRCPWESSMAQIEDPKGQGYPKGKSASTLGRVESW